MAMLLAPYTDSMRLGMGFNSYTQTLCVDGAVDIRGGEDEIRKGDASQVVSYSSRIVEKLTEVVSSMNVSYSSAMKKGTVEVAGDATAINEEKIKESDLNVVVSVKVTNQTSILKENPKFLPLKEDGEAKVKTLAQAVNKGQQSFTDFFGDCYISGFIKGGEFTAIVSIKILDQSKTTLISNAIKRSITKAKSTKFQLYPASGSGSSSSDSTSSSAFRETELTYSVSWMGGGQIKDPAVPWDLDNVFRVAAAFPQSVATCPQLTYAILTPYKANRSFQEWAISRALSPLNYDNVASYTAELFDNYMQYKLLIKNVGDMITYPERFTAQEKTAKANAIPLVVSTLTAVRLAMRAEMSKLVQAVDAITKDPTVLTRMKRSAKGPSDPLVETILSAQSLCNVQPVQPSKPSDTKRPSSDPDDTSGELTPASSGSSGPNNSKDSPKDRTDSSKDSTDNTEQPAEVLVKCNLHYEESKFDFNSLMAPEIWADLLPKPKPADTPPLPDRSGAYGNPSKSDFPAPPKQIYPLPSPAPTSKDPLRILAAVCGEIDVTDAVQKLVKHDDTLDIRASDVEGFLDAQAKASAAKLNLWIYLSFVFQYGAAGPLRLCIIKAEPSGEDKTTVYTISSAATHYPVLTPTTWNVETWSIAAIIYGAQQVADHRTSKVLDKIRKNYDSGKGRRECLADNTMLTDTWSGKGKTFIIFYRITEGGALHSTVGLEGSVPALLTDRLTIDKPTPAPQPTPQPATPGPEKVYMRALKVEKCTDAPFFRFPNGIGFVYGPDGNFVVKEGSNVKWDAKCGKAGRNMQGCVLQWQPDNKLCAYTTAENCYYCQNAGTGLTDKPVLEGHIVFCDHEPFIDMGLFSGGKWVSTWNSSMGS